MRGRLERAQGVVKAGRTPYRIGHAAPGDDVLPTAAPPVVDPPPIPRARLGVGVTGHRAAHPSFVGHEEAVEAAMAEILALVDAAVSAASEASAPTRLHTLLADGADVMAAEMALGRGWELVAPLPFGRKLNTAINALPLTAADANALLEGGEPADPDTARRAAVLDTLSNRAHLFTLADRDDTIAALFAAQLADPAAAAAAQLYGAETARRVALAGRILVEQSDIVVAVWDGATTALVGGTGHTVEAALEAGAPVVWIEPASAPQWRILHAPEALANRSAASGASAHARLREIVAETLAPDGGNEVTDGLGRESWHPRSHRLTHAYRRIEALFGGGGKRLRSLSQEYETPASISSGSFAWLRKGLAELPGGDPALDTVIDRQVLHRFAWADAVSARLSDKYRGGMIVSFVLSSLAIVGGLAYLPFVGPEAKWPFALFELALLLAIVAITVAGTRRRWHERWFETRRVAEYLRHAPIMLALGAARAPGRWPRSTDTPWPEWHVRQSLREVGLPRMEITGGYLRGALTALLDRHVTGQRDYHRVKAERLANVHHNLDRLSETLFMLAIVSVIAFIALWGAARLGLVDAVLVDHAAKPFTVLGVLFPTFGAGIAGIRYFGDFERFSAISEVTAEKLDAVHDRIALLEGAPDAMLDYGRVVELVHAADDIVVAEIENWQAVFGGKHITVPV